VLLKPFGPVHAYDGVPGDEFVAVRFKVCPLHNAPLLVATGVAGGLGSDNVNGPVSFDVQLFSTTLISSYTPSARPVITRLPVASDDNDVVTEPVLKV
jgi:hypothetical protein